LLLCIYHLAVSGAIAQPYADPALRRNWMQLDSQYIASLHNDPSNALQISREQMDLANRIQSDTLIFKSHMHRGSMLTELGIFDAGLTDFYTALSLSEKMNRLDLQSNALYGIGQIYQSMSDFDQSLAFYQKARSLAITAGAFLDTIKINDEIGFNLVAKGDRDKGLPLMEQSAAVALRIQDPELILYCLDNLSNVWSELGNNQKALQYELTLLQYPDAWNDNYHKAGVYEHLTEIYIRLKDWDNAQYYQKLALMYAQLIKSNDWIFECYKLQSKIDEARGDYKSALQNHKKYLELKDSVYQKQYDVKMAGMSKQYELESKQRTISLLEKDRQIQENQLERRQLERNVILLVSLLLVVIIWLVFRFFHNRTAESLREAFAHDLIMQQEAERQRISKELHDSVGQNILFIKNQLLKQDSGTSGQLTVAVDTALEEVRNISKALYPNQLDKYGLESAVASLCDLTSETTGIFVSHDLAGINEKLNKETRINLYRIIQECISNTLKHAEATAIRITSRSVQNKIELVVQDNGKGFDKGILERKSQRSFGLLNLEERVKMLHGKLELDTAVSRGTKLTFLFPA
jgi:signal transduction histidine kinase